MEEYFLPPPLVPPPLLALLPELLTCEISSKLLADPVAGVLVANEPVPLVDGAPLNDLDIFAMISPSGEIGEVGGAPLELLLLEFPGVWPTVLPEPPTTPFCLPRFLLGLCRFFLACIARTRLLTSAFVFISMVFKLAAATFIVETAVVFATLVSDAAE